MVRHDSYHVLRSYLFRGILTLSLLVGGSGSALCQLDIVRTSPGQNALTALLGVDIEVEFSNAINGSSVTSDRFRVFGQQTAAYSGRLEVTGNIVRFVPDQAFKEGEVISVFVSDQIRGTNNSTLLRSYQWNFNVRPEYGSARFEWVNPGNSALRSPIIIRLPRQQGPVSTFIGDLNDDFFPDLVVVNNTQSNIKIFSNTRRIDGVFQEETEISVGDGPRNVIGGDFNSDGRLDLVVTSILDNTLTVLLNQGNFIFSKTFVVTGARPISSVVIDFDGDGALDVATAAFGEDAIILHRNNGSGVFSLSGRLTTSQSPTSIVSRDLDGDGLPDLAVATAGERILEIFRNNGVGGFQAPNQIALGFTPEVLAVGDLLGSSRGTYGDGRLEIVMTAQDLNELIVYRAQNGISYSEALRVSLPTSPARGIVLADVDTVDTRGQQQGLGKDADLDIITSHFAEAKMHVFINDATEDFISTATSLLETGETPLGVSAADLERDGDIDIVVSNFTTDEIWIYLNEGGRTAFGGGSGISDGMADFGDVYVCQNESLTYTGATNQSLTPVQVTGISVSPATNVYRVTSNIAFPTTVSPGQTLPIEILFTPEETIRYDGIQIIINYNIGGLAASAVVSLFGAGVASQLQSIPTLLDFGSVVETESQIEVLSVQNVGTMGVNLTGVSFSEPAFSSAQIFPVFVGADGASGIQVTFSPLAQQFYNGTITFTTDDPCFPTFTVNVIGIGEELKPDLIATSITGPSSPTVTRFELYTGTFTLQRKEVNSSFSVQLVQDGVVMHEKNYTGFSEGQDTLSTFLSFRTLGTHTIELVVDSNDGVDEFLEDNNTTEIFISPSIGHEVFIRPNPFTPNGDGFNDRVQFDVGELALEAPLLEIFTLEGVPILESTEIINLALQWDGRDKQGRDQPAGVYLYIVKDANSVLTSGHITLAR